MSSNCGGMGDIKIFCVFTCLTTPQNLHYNRYSTLSLVCINSVYRYYQKYLLLWCLKFVFQIVHLKAYREFFSWSDGTLFSREYHFKVVI